MLQNNLTFSYVSEEIQPIVEDIHIDSGVENRTDTRHGMLFAAKNLNIPIKSLLVLHIKLVFNTIYLIDH